MDLTPRPGPCVFSYVDGPQDELEGIIRCSVVLPTGESLSDCEGLCHKPCDVLDYLFRQMWVGVFLEVLEEKGFPNYEDDGREMNPWVREIQIAEKERIEKTRGNG